MIPAAYFQPSKRYVLTTAALTDDIGAGLKRYYIAGPIWRQRQPDDEAGCDILAASGLSKICLPIGGMG